MSSYCTIEQGDALALEKFPSHAWDDASTLDKTKALAQATKLINNLNFSDAFDGEADAIIAACFELAYELLDGADPEKEMQSAYQSVSAFDAIRTSKSEVVHPRILHGIVSHQAWIYLQPYLRDPKSIRLTRV